MPRRPPGAAAARAWFLRIYVKVDHLNDHSMICIFDYQLHRPLAHSPTSAWENSQIRWKHPSVGLSIRCGRFLGCLLVDGAEACDVTMISYFVRSLPQPRLSFCVAYNNIRVGTASMCEKSTIESLISTSGEDDLEGLPLFYEGKIVKRTSKGEIQGWTQNQYSQPFHKNEADSRKRNLTQQRKKAKGLSEKFQDEDWTSPPTLAAIKKQLKDYGETKDLTQAFRTFSSLPEIAEDSALPRPAQQQPKQDFVKGIRFQNCRASHRRTAVLKPLPNPQSVSCEKAARIRSRSVSTAANKFRKRQSMEHKVSLICYPLDQGPSEAERAAAQSKLRSYMRRFQV